jgi:hypothetical protein
MRAIYKGVIEIQKIINLNLIRLKRKTEINNKNVTFKICFKNREHVNNVQDGRTY